MKTFKTILSTISKSFLIFILVISISSCSSDDDSGDKDGNSNGVTLPANKVTTYDGILSYQPNTGNDIVTTSGTATISGSSNNYTITFSDNVPSITGVTFNLINEKYVYTNPNDASEGIIIETTEDERLLVDMTINGDLTEFAGE